MVLFLTLSILLQPVIPAQAKPQSTKSTNTTYNQTQLVTTNSLHSISTYKLNYKKYKLVKGKSFALKVKKLPSNYKVTYKSMNKNIASVTTKGIVYGKRNGTTTITATVRYKNLVLRNLHCKVTVGVPAVSVVIPESSITLAKGEKKDLNAIVKPKYSTEHPRFVSSNPKVVTVTSAGIIQAVKKGSAIITVTIANKKFDKCIITVTNNSIRENKK